MLSEKVLERKLRDEVKKMGGIALKFVSPGHAGVYDRLVVFPFRKTWFAETKSTGKKLTALQEVFKKQMEKLGFPCVEIDTEEKLRAFLEQIKQELHYKIKN